MTERVTPAADEPGQAATPRPAQGPRYAPPDPPRISPQRQLAAAVIGCVIGAGASLYAASRTWLVQTTPRPAPQSPLVEHLTGSSLVPLLPALGLVALAGAGGLVAAKGLARSGVGVLLAAAGLGIVVLERAVLGRAGLVSGWVLLTALGGVAVATVGAFTLRNGPRWPVMGARYDRPTTVQPSGGASTPDGGADEALRPSGKDRPGEEPDSGVPTADTAWWDAIDRGEDPTKR